MLRALLKALALLLPFAIVVYLALGAALSINTAMHERMPTNQTRR